MQLKKIKVYGRLRQFLGKATFEAAVKSPAQAMSFLKANFSGIEQHMNDQLYRIKIGGRVVTEDLVQMSGEGDIQIIPVATGSGPLIPIALGAASLYGASFITAGTFLGSTFLLTALKTIGTTLIINGITDLLTPKPPSPTTDPRMKNSFSFSGIQNTSSSGVPIPIIYGLAFTGSIIISSGVDTTQVVKSIT